MALPKWNDEREAQLTALVNGESPVSTETVERVAEELETSTRSISSKLRRMGVEVAKKEADSPKFNEQQTELLKSIVENEPGAFTAQEVADKVGKDFSAMQVRGKLLSMDLVSNLKAAEHVAAPRKYTPEQEARIVEMVQGGSFVEDIAEEMDKTVNQIRGKCLSLLREVEGLAMPATRDKVADRDQTDPYADVDLEALTVAEIAEATNKTERAVKGHLTKVGVSSLDYNGELKRKNADKKAEEKEA